MSKKKKADKNGQSNGDSPDLPFSLTLEFSKAADYGNVKALFDPALKSKIDPGNFVAPRDLGSVRDSVRNGGAAILYDQNKNLKTITIAYRTHIKGQQAANRNHDYSELGTGVSRIPGYNSAQLIMAALAINEWWSAMPTHKIINEIDIDNLASVKTYRDYLGWEEITDQKETETLFDACYQNVSKDVGSGIGNPPPQAKRKNKSFYRFTDRALAIHARILLDFINQGGLINKRTQHRIPVNFSALDDAGLTYSFLTAVAGGETDKQRLRPLSKKPPKDKKPPAP